MEFLTNTKLQKNSNPGLFIACLIISFLLLALMIWPKYNSYKAKNKSLTDAQTENQRLVDEKASVIAAISDMENNNEDITKAKLAIPSTQDEPDVYALIETLAQSANLKLGALQISEPITPVAQSTAIPGAPAVDGAVVPVAGAPTSSAPTLPAVIGVTQLNIEVLGTVDSFNQFLSAVENNLRIIDVQSIDVSKVPDRDQLSFRLLLKTYYQK